MILSLSLGGKMNNNKRLINTGSASKYPNKKRRERKKSKEKNPLLINSLFILTTLVQINQFFNLIYSLSCFCI